MITRRATLWIALAALLVYAGAWTSPLVYDDLELIPHQPVIRTPGNLAGIFQGGYWGELREHDTLYRPFTIWTLALCHGANRVLGRDGFDPLVFRLVNIGLHAGVSCLVFLFLVRCGLERRAALAAALLFAVHPIHSEVVDSIVNRSESLAALCGLAFLILHHARRDGDRHIAFQAGACIALFLALSSKESAVALLPLVLWLDRKTLRRRTASYLVYLIPVGVWLLLRANAVGGVTQRIFPIDNPLVEASPVQRILTACAVQARYLALQVWPARLSTDYSFEQVPVVSSVTDPWLAFFAVSTAILLATGWRLRRSHPFVLSAVVGYAICFLPAGNLLFPIGTIMAERLAYSPSIFFIALAAYGVAILARRDGATRRATVAALAVTLVVLGFRTVQQNRTWRDPDVFYETQVRTAPGSAKAHYSRGKRLLLAGRIDDAIAENRRAVEIFPNYPDAWNHLGAAFERKGNRGTAVEMYGKAVDLQPSHAQALFNLGRIAQEDGDAAGAVEFYRAALQHDPRHLEACNNLGILFAESGRLDEAREQWLRALAVNPGFAPARENLELLAHGGVPPPGHSAAPSDSAAPSER